MVGISGFIVFLGAVILVLWPVKWYFIRKFAQRKIGRLFLNSLFLTCLSAIVSLGFLELLETERLLFNFNVFRLLQNFVWIPLIMVYNYQIFLGFFSIVELALLVTIIDTLTLWSIHVVRFSTGRTILFFLANLLMLQAAGILSSPFTGSLFLFNTRVIID